MIVHESYYINTILKILHDLSDMILIDFMVFIFIIHNNRCLASFKSSYNMKGNIDVRTVGYVLRSENFKDREFVRSPCEVW